MNAEQLVPVAWLGFWRAMQHYHRFETEGFENLIGGGAALLVAYHARGVASDVCMLSVDVHDRLGYLPHAIFHEGMGRLPVFRTVLRGLGGVTNDDRVLSDAVARGEHIVVLPGGGREAFRSACHRYTVDWGDRVGYLRLALRLGIPLIPIGAAGVDDLYLGLNDGRRWGRRLRVPFKLPFWIALGATGPFPSLPFPVAVRQVIGERIPLDAAGPVSPDDPDSLLALHRLVTRRVQEAIDRALGCEGA